MNDIGQKSIIIYQSSDGKTTVEVNLQKDTVWLNQKQMGILFDKNYKTISRHINNIYRQGELERDSTVSYFETVRNEGGRKVVRNLEFYNLDMIISVGYRVNSKCGTQFRIWATNVLKDHLINGYSICRKRLENQTEKIKELSNTISFIEDVVKEKQLTSNEAEGLFNVVSDYIKALDFLDDYDHQRLKVSKDLTKKLIRKLDYEEITKAINELKKYFRNKGEQVELFGVEKDQSLKSSISTIYQTFDDKDLYPSVEEKAANLLYFLIKNHSFVDGNKRIAAFIFIWFLKLNGILYKESYLKRISDDTLVALCLLVAQSKPEEKDLITKIIVKLIC